MSKKVEECMDIIETMDNSELYELKEQLDKEIRLSETAIKEGYEDR